MIFPIKKQKINAFTLAEVLITLGIIGVVAAMTIPTLMNKTQDEQFKVAYKKAFSVASQAWAQAVNDGDIVYRPSWTDYDSRIANFKAFKSKFKVIKDCDGVVTLNDKCWDNSGEGFNGTSFPLYNTDPMFIDSSGVAWADEGQGSGIIIDTNGLKKPNQFGKDRFRLSPVVSGTDINIKGIPVKIVPEADYINPDASHCVYGSCYNTSWLYQ